MKLKFFLFLFVTIHTFAQEDIYFLKDSENKFSIDTIINAEFNLLSETILEKHSNASYWFKIPAYKTESKYIFKIIYERYNDAKAYQNGKKIKKLSNQRYLSYKFYRDYDVYIKVSPQLHSYIPVELASEEESTLKNDSYLLLNGFYYGFAFLVIIYNLCYFFLFKDDAFLNYSLFLTTVTFGVFTMDGMLNFYGITGDINNFIMVVNYTFLAYFSSRFINSYLFLDLYFPKVKKFSYAFGIFIIIFGILYLNFNNYYYLLVLGILVFSLLFIYWFIAILLFKNNMHIKILVFAYTIILFSGIDYYILKFLGISIVNIDAISIKIGAFLEMIILSIAVIYRMNTLKEENDFMRHEIISYSNELKSLSNEISEEKQHESVILETVLSAREEAIFKLIVSGKSNKEVANHLNISVNTVKFHVKNIYEKLNIKSRKEAIIIAKSHI